VLARSRREKSWNDFSKALVNQLKDLDWEKYHKEHGDVLRLDRILENEGDAVDHYKAVKQADVLMLFYLFSAQELQELFAHMGYTFDPKSIPLNINYYQEVTAHGSTLSKLVYSWVLARSRREKSWNDFSKALVSDFEDIQGGTTSEGIHLGAMAGTVDLIQRCYTGIEFRDDALRFNPKLPKKIKKIEFRLHYRKQYIDIALTPDNLRLSVFGGWNNGTNIIINNKKYKLKRGEVKNFKLSDKKKKKK
jgi:alpha,alpha-trehalase